MALATSPYTERYEQSFSAFSGSHIVATFNGRHIAELQGITYSITKEVVPIFTLGSSDARAFASGKRGIAGSLIFQTFNRNALLEEMKKNYKDKPSIAKYQTFISNMSSFRAKYLGGDQLAAERGAEIDVASVDDMLTSSLDVDAGGVPLDWGQIIQEEEIEYNDQLPPFHISIAFANEEGNRARMEIFGVKIVNEGMTLTVDDPSLETAMTFVARKVRHIRPDSSSGKRFGSVGLERRAASEYVPGVGMGSYVG